MRCGNRLWWSTCVHLSNQYGTRFRWSWCSPVWFIYIELNIDQLILNRHWDSINRLYCTICTASHCLKVFDALDILVELLFPHPAKLPCHFVTKWKNPVRLSVTLRARVQEYLPGKESVSYIKRRFNQLMLKSLWVSINWYWAKLPYREHADQLD